MASGATTPAEWGPTRPEQIRNVVLVGPAGSGKTALFERLIAARTNRPARGEPKPSSTLNAASLPPQEAGGVTVNLLDTPGTADFVGDVRAGLRGADAALFVIAASDPVDDATQLLWRECAATGRPRAIAITKLEQTRADFDDALARCRLVFGDVQPLLVPLLEDGKVLGLVDLLRETTTDHSSTPPESRQPTDEERELLEQYRGSLMESIIEESEDEDLLERHLEGEKIPFDTVADDLRAAVATARFFPLLPTHAPGGVGIEELLRLFERGFPSPAAAPLPRVFDGRGAADKPFGPLTCDPEGPLVAEVIRTSSDPFVGRLSLVRVFSGTLTSDAALHVAGHLRSFAAHQAEGHADHDIDDERLGPLSAPIGDETRPKPFAVAGDIVLVAKLTSAETTDTLSTKSRPALVEPWVLPEPLLPVAIHAVTRAEEEKLAAALPRLVAEDVTMRLEHNPETHQIVLWAMGPAHVDRLLATLADTWHVRVEVEPVRTSLRETFVAKTPAQARLVKQSGGHGQYAVCQFEIEPLERGAGIEFGERIVGGAVPKQYIASVEKGVRQQLSKGLLAGYPVVDVRVTLVDGKAHSVDSSDMAFQTAAAMALRDAATTTTMAMLEPIDRVDITVSEDSLGAVLADLRGRRGQVHGTEATDVPGQVVIHAEVPAHELARYAIDLRSVSHGTGTFSRSFARYDYLPTSLRRELAGV
jgi:elongation factor G